MDLNRTHKTTSKESKTPKDFDTAMEGVPNRSQKSNSDTSSESKETTLFNNSIYNNLFHSNSLPMMVVDPQPPNQIVAINSTAIKLLKLHNQESTKLNIYNISSTPLPRIKEKINFMKRGKNSCFQLELLDKNKNTLTIRFHSCLLPFEGKNYLHFTLENRTEFSSIQKKLSQIQYQFEETPNTESQEVATNRIPGRKEIEKSEEMERVSSPAEDRFTKAIELSSDSFWEWDGKTRTVYRSKRWYDMLNYPYGQFEETVDSWQNLIHPEDLSKVDKHLQAHLRNETGLFECEYRMKSGSGDYKWILDRGKVFEWDDNGKFIRMIGSHKDITEEKMARVSMLVNKEKFRALVENSNDIIFRFNLSGEVLYMNPYAHRFFEKTGSKETNFPILPQQLYSNLKNLLQETAINGSITRKTIQFKLKKKSYLFDWQINPEFNLQSEVKTLIACGRDITLFKKTVDELKKYRSHLEKLVNDRTIELTREIDERKRIEKQLIHAKQKAEASDQLKSAFLGNLSHEVRTPMNAIMGFTSLLSSPDLSAEKKNNFIKYINTNAHCLLELINDILVLSKLEADELKVEFDTFDGISFIKSQKKLLEYKLKELKKQKNVKILSEIPTDVTKFPLRTDRFRLSQIFSKLISNAIKFTEKGFIRIGFTKGKKGRIQFFIEDSGIGIQPDYIPYIFMRFTKIDKPNEKLYRGMGMGLTIAQKIVQLLGGEIFIDSQPTKGSRFYFEIPCLMNLPNPNINPSKTKKMKLPQYDWSRKTILIAEDVESNFLFLDEVIKKTGATILWATNGEKAIDLFKKHKIDLILMDIQMPVMNGFEATRIIKKINPSIPIISQTAYAMAEDRDKSLEAGCDDYISKPIPTIKLLNLLANYINVRVEEK